MSIRLKLLIAVVLLMTGVWGCTAGPGGSDAQVSAVTSKATEVAQQIGGQDGFGGPLMQGYLNHGPAMMGFVDGGDLATSNAMMNVRCVNQAGEDATFHMAYFASPMGFADRFEDIEIAAGSTVDVQIPCAEIMGFGSLETPGAVGCHLASGAAVDNRLAVPGFLNLDYACSGTYQCTLAEDTDDLDGDGDTTELVMITGGMQTHMMNGGPGGHSHGPGPGMMGPHMGF
jgi:hypothetical protein